MIRSIALGVVALMLAGCAELGWDECEARFPTINQAAAARIDLPGLGGVVVVTSLDGEELTRGEVDGSSGNIILYGVPTGEPVNTQILWEAGGYVVAETELKVSEVDWVNTACVEFQEADFVFPDDDGDGAINLFEVAFENEVGERGEGAPGDPTIVPDGFFSDVVDLIPLADVAFGLAVRELASELLVTTPASDATGAWTHNEINLIDLGNHRRHSELIPCSGFATAALFNPINRASTGAVGCGSAVHLLNVDFATFDLSATVNTGAFASLAYSKTGDVLYKVGPTEVVGILADGSLHSGTQSDAWDDTQTPWSLADTGNYLLVPDRGNRSLNVIFHWEDDVGLHSGWSMFGDLIKPGAIVLHPAGHRAYVAEEETGKVLVIDLTDQSALELSDPVVAEIEASPPPIHLAIDQRDGYWLYVTTAEKILRVNTLTNEVESEISIGGPKNIPTAIAVSSEGSHAVVATRWGATYVLGHGAQSASEHEPNNGLATAGTLDRSMVGWLDTDDEGEQSTPWSVDDGAPDDFEDLWSVTAPAATEHLAVALIPTRTDPAFKLALLDGAGEVVESIISSLGSTLTPGTGIFLLSPGGAAFPNQAFIGVSLRDNTPAVSPYVLKMSRLADLPAVAEVEDNGQVANAQALNGYPMILNAAIDAAETGDFSAGAPADDFEDCFSLYTGDTHLAVRLDFPSDVDLNLAVLDSSGAWMERHASIARDGQPEVMIFEPQTRVDRHTVCVGIIDSAPVTTATYTLTLVDFSD